jgi:iron complex outermembrane recepter protein
MAPSSRSSLACLVVLLSAASSRAIAAIEDSKQLTRLSIEDLAAVKVVTVSRRPETDQEAAGAVHVITAEDIRRTGSTTIPDALRTAPGLQASRIDADEWALAIRGFASRLSRSVLAVMDGRSVWTPLFAGVFWDAQDTLLEDIEQIEVSRGPGGAVYGANALNGVINITTKSARDTHGGLVTLRGGPEDKEAGLRWGGVLGTGLHYRVFGKYSARDDTKPVTPAGYDDRWDMRLGGFRLDWSRGERDRFTVLGDLYDGSSPQPATVAIFTAPYSVLVTGDAAFRGRSLVSRWNHTLEGGSEISTQAYYDHTTRREPYYGESRDTFDLEVQHRFHWGGHHDFIWGADYRGSTGTFDGSAAVRIVPSKREDDIAGLFANDELRLLGNRLRITFGTKLEWNDYSGWNVQPSGRLAWVLSRHTFWGSATRGVRTSSRLERDVILYSSLSPKQPLFARTTGSPDFTPESVFALEAGYKLRLSRLILTASAFRNAYYDLATNQVGAPVFEAGTGDEPTRTVIPVSIANGPGGTAKGFEAKAVFSAFKSWRLQGSYSFLTLDLGGDASKGFQANSPRHQFWLTSYLTPLPKLDVDLVFRAVGSIPGHNIPAFVDVDARVAFRPRAAVELSLVGTNLLQGSRPEFGGGFEVERAGRLQATIRF